ncbi:hypothetical protein [Methylibium sp.]|uniref:hypothetical protein n=1 Tax=Methylibium sp. TaxID=2067992 RepID=UPI0025F1065F|nr:hypothetical protein [Methylibium sp.]
MAGQLSDRTNETTELKTALLAALEKLGALERELHVAQVKAQAAGGRVEEVRESTDRLAQQDAAGARPGSYWSSKSRTSRDRSREAGRPHSSPH